jgi:hypothetical protein
MLQSGVDPLFYAGINVIVEEIVTTMKLVSNYRYRLFDYTSTNLANVCQVLFNIDFAETISTQTNLHIADFRKVNDNLIRIYL